MPPMTTRFDQQYPCALLNFFACGALIRAPRNSEFVGWALPFRLFRLRRLFKRSYAMTGKGLNKVTIVQRRRV
jgi:hypothetical protein